MVATASTMLPLGSVAPDFTLADPEGNAHALASIADGKRGVLVAFLCNHCPYVQHIRYELARLTGGWQQHGIAVVGINANDSGAYPDDAPGAMALEARSVGYTFPYLVDATQETARAYHAACTPDFYLFDRDLHLVYRGQFDDRCTARRPSHQRRPAAERRLQHQVASRERADVSRLGVRYGQR
jgi:peroxiredoxin